MEFGLISIGEHVRWFNSVLAAGVLLYGAWCDIRSHELPDALSFILVGLWLIEVMLAVVGGVFMWGDFLLSMGYALVFFALGFVLFLLNAAAFGGGDVKLMSAFILWIGSALAPLFIVFTILVGGIMSVFVLLYSFYQRGWGATLQQRKEMHFAYAPAIAIGGWIVIAHRMLTEAQV